MNDFLQSLNNGQKNKRVPRTRKAFDNNHSYNSTPKFHSGKYQGVRNGNTQRPGNGRQNFQTNAGEKTNLLSAEAVDKILSFVRKITINQELLIDVQERRLAVEERKADALENIADCFNSLTGELETEEDKICRDESFQEKEEKSPEISSANLGSEDRKVLSREEAMAMICRMRDHGATFNQIAKHLIEIGQPTFSGKGKWHAQTIHRLMQKQKQLESV